MKTNTYKGEENNVLTQMVSQLTGLDIKDIVLTTSLPDKSIELVQVKVNVPIDPSSTPSTTPSPNKDSPNSTPSPASTSNTAPSPATPSNVPSPTQTSSTTPSPNKDSPNSTPSPAPSPAKGSPSSTPSSQQLPSTPAPQQVNTPSPQLSNVPSPSIPGGSGSGSSTPSPSDNGSSTGGGGSGSRSSTPSSYSSSDSRTGLDPSPSPGTTSGSAADNTPSATLNPNEGDKSTLNDRDDASMSTGGTANDATEVNNNNDSNKDQEGSSSIVVGVVAGGVVFCCIGFVALLLLVRFRNKRNAMHKTILQRNESASDLYELKRKESGSSINFQYSMHGQGINVDEHKSSRKSFTKKKGRMRHKMESNKKERRESFAKVKKKFGQTFISNPLATKEEGAMEMVKLKDRNPLYQAAVTGSTLEVGNSSTAARTTTTKSQFDAVFQQSANSKIENNQLYVVAGSDADAGNSTAHVAVEETKKRGSFRAIVDDTGRTYYHCEDTQQVQWEQPAEHEMIEK